MKAGELALIQQIRARVGERKTAALRLGIGDDCALLRLGTGEELAVTTDLSIEGRHFRLDWHAPEVVGHRTLARGLSDLAAMGARPLAAFVSLGLPRELAVKQGRRRAWVDGFYEGLLALAEAYNCPLAGGDLAESPVAVADIVLLGAVPRGRALLRSGARPGDLLYVTGALGGAAAGLARLREFAGKETRVRPPVIPKKMQAALAAHLYPQPRGSQGLWLLRKKAATAAIDLSDGLSTDLAHLCEESGVAAEVDASALPIAAGASLEQALDGGEDYELLFTAGPTVRMPRAIRGVQVTQIGRVVPGKAGRGRAGRPPVVLVTAAGAKPLEPRGWEHFS